MSRLRWLGEVVEMPVIRQQRTTSMPEDLQALLLQGKDLDSRKQEMAGRGKKRRDGASLPAEVVAEIDAWTTSVPAVLEKHAAYIESIQVERVEAAAAFATKIREAVANARQRAIEGRDAHGTVPSYCGAFVGRAPIAEALAAVGAGVPDGVEWIDDLHCTLRHVLDPSCGGSLDSMQALVGRAATVVADAL